jgi:hypothetical protein
MAHPPQPAQKHENLKKLADMLKSLHDGFKDSDLKNLDKDDLVELVSLWGPMDEENHDPRPIDGDASPIKIRVGQMEFLRLVSLAMALGIAPKFFSRKDELGLEVVEKIASFRDNEEKKKGEQLKISFR